MTSPPTYWPLTSLRLRTSGLELRVPDAADLADLAALAAAGVHDEAVQPFATEWTDVEPAARALSTMQFHWSCWGSWTPSDWSLNLVTVHDGSVVGTQGIGARDFAVLREVHTGSWIGQRYQGQGFGTAMRAAVLALAFDGLGADHATSAAFLDNPASLAISRTLGYCEDGLDRQTRRGMPAVCQRLRLDRASWLRNRVAEVEIEGLESCLPLFGLG